MKLNLIFVIILAALLLSCNQNRHYPGFVPDEYLVPEKDREEGRTYVYRNQSTGEWMYYNIYNLYRDGKKYFLTVSRDSRNITDSVIWLNDRTIESWFPVNDTVARSIILKDTVIDNGKNLGRKRYDFRNRVDSMQLDYLTESEFEKDTVFTWQNRQLPAIIVLAKLRMITTAERSGQITDDQNTHAYTYYAKGIGLVRMRIFHVVDKDYLNIDLVEIRKKWDSKGLQVQPALFARQ